MEDRRALLLKHLLPLVPFDGWSDASLRDAGKKAKLEPQEVAAAFPQGALDAIDFFFTREDEALGEAFTAKQLSDMRMPDRIEALVMARFSHLAPNREAVRRAIAFYALPWNVPHGLQSLYRTVDAMWRLAGDQSLDFNFYSKRMTLAGVCSATILFWLNDRSENQSGTRDFLKRRLADVASFGKIKKDWKKKFRRA